MTGQREQKKTIGGEKKKVPGKKWYAFKTPDKGEPSSRGRRTKEGDGLACGRQKKKKGKRTPEGAVVL